MKYGLPAKRSKTFPTSGTIRRIDGRSDWRTPITRLLITFCRKGAGNPVLFGREYKELGEKVYGFKANKHIVFYRIPDDGAIEVVRILHERMDLSNRFAD